MHMHCAACYKGHHVTLVLHPQRDIDREKGRERKGEGEREREGERAGSSVVSIETQYCKTIYLRCIIGRRDKYYQDSILQVQFLRH